MDGSSPCNGSHTAEEGGRGKPPAPTPCNKFRKALARVPHWAKYTPTPCSARSLSVTLCAVWLPLPGSLVLAALTLCAGCHSGPGAGRDAGLANDGHASEQEAGSSALLWQRREVELEADGRSAPLHFSIDAQERPVFALRTYADDAEVSRSLCFQLEEVRADNHALWVPTASSDDYGDYCTRCAQPVAAGSGYGFFLLPSAAALPASFGTISLRVALRDCLTLSPLWASAPRPPTLVIESATYSAPERTHTLSLPLAFVMATPHTFTAGADFDEMFARVREIWREADIELAPAGPFVMARPEAPVSYGPEQRVALAALTRDARELVQNAHVAQDTPLVIFTPCLVRESTLGEGETQPLAMTAHIPGGFALPREADGIFVAGERCGGLAPGPRYVESATLAAIVAHEVGHFLGLFHVREADGREDALADTSPEMANLMQALPSAPATALAETQIEIARRHVSLAAHRSE